MNNSHTRQSKKSTGKSAGSLIFHLKELATHKLGELILKPQGSCAAGKEDMEYFKRQLIRDNRTGGVARKERGVKIRRMRYDYKRGSDSTGKEMNWEIRIWKKD